MGGGGDLPGRKITANKGGSREGRRTFNKGEGRFAEKKKKKTGGGGSRT